MSNIYINSGSNKKKKKRLRPKPQSHTDNIDSNDIYNINHTIISDTLIEDDTGRTKAEQLLKLTSNKKLSNKIINNNIHNHNNHSTNNSNDIDNTNQPNNSNKQSKLNKQNTTTTTINTKHIRNGKLMSLSIDGISSLYNSDIPHSELCSTIFEWLIYPLNKEQFYNKYYENKPFIIHRYKQFQPKKCKLITLKHSYINEYQWYKQHRDNNNIRVSEGNNNNNNNNNKHVEYYILSSGEKTDELRSEHYYDGIYSQHDIDDILHHRNSIGGNVEWSDFNIVKYNNYVRSDVNITGKIIPKNIWDLVYEEKCGLRFLCPHKYNNTLHRLINVLDNQFGMFVGSNMYYTPANSQSFAPHYDDVGKCFLLISLQSYDIEYIIYMYIFITNLMYFMFCVLYTRCIYPSM